ncbi:GNAT family N-acetyltransferase [Piscinibacter sakaiensis]|uniref:GNAT family N-acetyltransferase n=1 Tax=Piscinibacter sakaiensis TaxID=1547922 RepID=UPI003AAE8127
MSQLLDNIAWHSLNGVHLPFAAGGDSARRYARGFSPIIAFADKARPDFNALEEVCAPGETFYCDGWSGAAPHGWQIDDESTMLKMVWAAPMPAVDTAPGALRLDKRHAAQALELAAVARPGPFGERSLELGDYFGLFDGARLVAMAGERMQAGGWREISGVCTDPQFEGRGLARSLVLKLVRRQWLRGQMPFLHVMRDNTSAHRLYRRLGFADARESVVRVVSRLS